MSLEIRKEFTGMLQAAIDKFEDLLILAEALNPIVIKGYDSSQGDNSFFFWGCACQITCTDMPQLKTLAESFDILWADDDSGCMAYTNGLDINDFKTYRVNSNLELMPESLEL
jgi:hypothetical protein